MNNKLGGSMRYRDAGPASAISAGLSGGQLELVRHVTFGCGHPASGTNYYVLDNGTVRCLECKQAAARIANAIRREKNAA